MPGADVVVVQKDASDGRIYLQDRYTDAYAEPRQDDCRSNGKSLIKYIKLTSNRQFSTKFKLIGVLNRLDPR